MKYLFAILISLMSVTPTFTAERIYATGCIPSTPEDWERAGVPLRSPSEELRASRLARLPSGTASLSSTRLADSKPILPRYEILTMSDVKNQHPLGTCSIFAIVAAIEAQLPKGTVISEAELFTRVKMIVEARVQEGVALSRYIPLLKEGVVLDHQYVNYEIFSNYVIIVVKNKASVTLSLDYIKSLNELKDHATKLGKAPEDFRPTWDEKRRAHIEEQEKEIEREIEESKGKTNTYWFPLPYLGIPINIPGSSVVRCGLNLDEISRLFFTRILTPQSFMPLPRLNVSVIFTRDSRGTCEDELIKGLKQSICNNVSVVVDVKTFARYKFAPGNGDYDKLENGLYREVHKEKGAYEKVSQWLSDSVSPNNGFIVTTKIPDEYGWEGAHAICICGYDNAYQPDKSKPAVSAFKFKNSWGRTYGNEGYAWLTEDYVRQHTYNALVLDVNGRQ